MMAPRTGNTEAVACRTCVVCCIPAQFSVRDLRRFFGDFVERSRIAAFHYLGTNTASAFIQPRRAIWSARVPHLSSRCRRSRSGSGSRTCARDGAFQGPLLPRSSSDPGGRVFLCSPLRRNQVGGREGARIRRRMRRPSLHGWRGPRRGRRPCPGTQVAAKSSSAPRQRWHSARHPAGPGRAVQAAAPSSARAGRGVRPGGGQPQLPLLLHNVFARVGGGGGRRVPGCGGWRRLLPLALQARPRPHPRPLQAASAPPRAPNAIAVRVCAVPRLCAGTHTSHCACARACTCSAPACGLDAADRAQGQPRQRAGALRGGRGGVAGITQPGRCTV